MRQPEVEGDVGPGGGGGGQARRNFGDSNQSDLEKVHKINNPVATIYATCVVHLGPSVVLSPLCCRQEGCPLGWTELPYGQTKR